MKLKYLLISLLLFLFLVIAVLFLFPSSVRPLCEISGCKRCGVIGHHVNKVKQIFSITIESYIRQLLVILFGLGCLSIIILLLAVSKKHLNFKLYKNYKLLKTFSGLAFNPLQRAYSDGIIERQIYNLT